MPNHFHLLVKAKRAEGSPSGGEYVYEKLQTGYSMYFNKKYERSGCLFQGPFKAQYVDKDPIFNIFLLIFI